MEKILAAAVGGDRPIEVRAGGMGGERDADVVGFRDDFVGEGEAEAESRGGWRIGGDANRDHPWAIFLEANQWGNLDFEVTLAEEDSRCVGEDEEGEGDDQEGGAGGENWVRSVEGGGESDAGEDQNREPEEES